MKRTYRQRASPPSSPEDQEKRQRRASPSSPQRLYRSRDYQRRPSPDDTEMIEAMRRMALPALEPIETLPPDLVGAVLASAARQMSPRAYARLIRDIPSRQARTQMIEAQSRLEAREEASRPMVRRAIERDYQERLREYEREQLETELEGGVFTRSPPRRRSFEREMFEDTRSRSPRTVLREMKERYGR